MSLPELNASYPLDRDCVKAFRRDGHTLVRGLMSRDEVSAWRPIIERAALKYRSDKRPLDERDTYGKAFIQSTNLWHRDPSVAGFSLARRFARVAAELMGADGVRMYHDQALFKEPGGGFTPWHQDCAYWIDLPDRIRNHGARTFKEAGSNWAYFGDPSKASVEEGHAIFAALAQMLASTAKEIL